MKNIFVRYVIFKDDPDTYDRITEVASVGEIVHFTADGKSAVIVDNITSKLLCLPLTDIELFKSPPAILKERG